MHHSSSFLDPQKMVCSQSLFQDNYLVVVLSHIPIALVGVVNWVTQIAKIYL